MYKSWRLLDRVISVALGSLTARTRMAKWLDENKVVPNFEADGERTWNPNSGQVRMKILAGSTVRERLPLTLAEQAGKCTSTFSGTEGRRNEGGRERLTGVMIVAKWCPWSSREHLQSTASFSLQSLLSLFLFLSLCWRPQCLGGRVPCAHNHLTSMPAMVLCHR